MNKQEPSGMFVLDKTAVRVAGGAVRAGRHKARLSRALTLSSSYMTFTHAPTGVKVTGRVLPGHYSRREHSGLNQRLAQALYSRLEYEVSKHLRAPGRRTLTRRDHLDCDVFEIVVGDYKALELSKGNRR